MRTTAVITTIAALYILLWDATNRQGVPRHIQAQSRPLADMGHQPDRVIVWVDAPAPLLLREFTYEMPPKNGLCQQLNYRVWFFGVEYSLPIRGSWVYTLDDDVRVSNWLHPSGR